ncbi:MAG: hypothetical protein H7318_19510 [Oligoflexus sp.]|nr:hypothetical protein [Oligoflexus sp.]
MKTSDSPILKSIRDDLQSFSSLENPQGFLPDFFDWVVREWSLRPFYATEIVNYGYDLTHYPQKTDYLLREKSKTYRDFIHANNGHHYVNFLPDHGTSCATMEKNLYEFFHESMRVRALAFLEENYPEMEAEVFWNQIFCEDFTRREDLLICEEINEKFGFYGLSAEPYLCSYHPEDGERGFYFDHWELKDFRAALKSYKNNGGKISPSERKRYQIILKALSPNALKKPLSQNGAIA